MNRKDRPFIFMLKFLREKNYNFLQLTILQLTIENQQKGCYLMSRSTPGTPGTLFWGPGALQVLFIWVPECLRNSYNFMIKIGGKNELCHKYLLLKLMPLVAIYKKAVHQKHSVLLQLNIYWHYRTFSCQK